MSTRSSLPQVVGLLLVLSCSSLFVELTYASCDCGFGTVAITSPYCSCTCTSGSGFAPPLCHYKTDEKQLIAFSLDSTAASAYTSPEQFSSDMLTRRLQTAFGLSDTQGEIDIVLRQRVIKTADQQEQETDAQKSQFTVQVMIASSLVPTLLERYYNTTKPSWVAEAGVLSVLVYSPLLPDESYAGLASSFVLGDLAGASISLNTLGWLIGAFVLTAALLITDGVMLNVTDAQRMHAKGLDVDTRTQASLAGVELELKDGEEPDELYMTDAELDAYRAMKASKSAHIQQVQEDRQQQRPLSADGGQEVTAGSGTGNASAAAPRDDDIKLDADGVDDQTRSETFSDLKKAPTPHPSPSPQASFNDRPASTISQVAGSSSETAPTTPPHHLPRKSSLIHASNNNVNNGSDSSPSPSSAMRQRGESVEKPPFLVDEESSLRHAGEGDIVDSTTSRTADAFRAKSPTVDRGPPSPSSPAVRNVLTGSVRQDNEQQEEFKT